MSVSGVSGAGAGGGIYNVGDTKVDLASLMFMVQAERANILDSQVRSQAQAIQAKNTLLRNTSNITGEIRAFQEALKNEQSQATNYKGMMDDYKGKNWAIGRAWPNGEYTGEYRWFQERGMTMDVYVRGNVSDGSPAAYDSNKGKLDGYISGINEGTATLPPALQAQFNKIKEFCDANGISITGGLKNMENNLSNVKNYQDALTSTSQLDMAQLQAVMGKYNQTWEGLSNFINKHGQSLNTLTSNLRG